MAKISQVCAFDDTIFQLRPCFNRKLGLKQLRECQQ